LYKSVHLIGQTIRNGKVLQKGINGGFCSSLEPKS
jgi:hypothetical protein